MPVEHGRTVESDTRLPDLEPATDGKRRSCLYCSHETNEPRQCPASGLWFCDDQCRQQYRASQNRHFTQRINFVKFKAPHQQQANDGRRHSERNKHKVVLIDAALSKPTTTTTTSTKRRERPVVVRATTTTATTTQSKKRKRPDERRDKREDKREDLQQLVSSGLVDSISARQHRIIEDMERVLEKSRVDFQKKRDEQSDEENARQLEQMRKNREAIVDRLKALIEALDKSVDLVDQTCELWGSMHIREIDLRYDTTQQWRDNDLARLDKLRAAYDSSLAL